VSGQVSVVAVFSAAATPRPKLASQTVSSVTLTINVGKQHNPGVEASLGALLLDRPAQALSRVRPWLSYTYTDAR
jgi:hypothetical protein